MDGFVRARERLALWSMAQHVLEQRLVSHGYGHRLDAPVRCAHGLVLVTVDVRAGEHVSDCQAYQEQPDASNDFK
jgi:hypothetical protein